MPRGALCGNFNRRKERAAHPVGGVSRVLSRESVRGSQWVIHFRARAITRSAVCISQLPAARRATTPPSGHAGTQRLPSELQCCDAQHCASILRDHDGVEHHLGLALRLLPWRRALVDRHSHAAARVPRGLRRGSGAWRALGTAHSPALASSFCCKPPAGRARGTEATVPAQSQPPTSNRWMTNRVQCHSLQVEKAVPSHAHPATHATAASAYCGCQPRRKERCTVALPAAAPSLGEEVSTSSSSQSPAGGEGCAGDGCKQRRGGREPVHAVHGASAPSPA